MSIEAYEELTNRFELYGLLKEGMDDVAAGHIEFVLKKPKAVADLLDEAEKQMNSLSDFPEKFCLADDPVLSSRGIRFVIVNHYLAFCITNPFSAKHVLKISFLEFPVPVSRDWYRDAAVRDNGRFRKLLDIV